MGHVTVVGGCRAKAPLTGILASTLPVGSVVKLMEGGAAVEYLVVNQGIPSNSSLYDSSCDGTWLLRKDIHSSRQWNTSNMNNYASSVINTWLNGDFFNSLGSIEKATIKSVKLPYVNGTGGSAVASGANGLAVQIFLLSGYEMGWTQSTNSYFPIDGACLSYFSGLSQIDSKRIAYLNGTATLWWLRSPQTSSTSIVWSVFSNGGLDSNYGASYSHGIRPALILPSTAKFDATTMLLKG